MHQNQWLATIEAPEADGLDGPPGPSRSRASADLGQVACQYLSCWEGEKSGRGGPGVGIRAGRRGEVEYVTAPSAMGEEIVARNPVDPPVHGTPRKPTPPVVD